MKKILLVIILVTHAMPNIMAQATRGRVQDGKGEAVSFASIYIRELKQGISANENGEFELKLPNGNYSLVFQSMGYETKTVELSLPQNRPLVITLAEKAYEIRTIQMSANREDPAYGIMRRAISRAPYYRNVVKEYTSDVYLKTKVNVEQIKGVAAMALKKEDRKKLSNLSFVQESVNEIKFFAPDRYEQKIKSIISGSSVDLSEFGIDNDDLRTGMAQFNIYGTNPSLPLAPGAFSNYKFKFEGDMQVGDFLVNKIKVIPRRKSDDLISGYLYIIDKTSGVYSLDITQTNTFGSLRVQQSYGDVGNQIYLPVSYNVEIKISAFGAKGSGNLIGSVSYLSVVTNTRIENSTKTVTTPPTPQNKTATGVSASKNQQKKEKLQEDIQEIVVKENLNNREMQKVARLQMQVVELAQKEELIEKGEKRSLEVQNDNYTFTTDSMATKRDTAYWNQMRPVPLLEAEFSTYLKNDSIAAVNTGRDTFARKKSTASKILGVVTGTDYRIDSSLSIRFGGLISTSVIDYNTVDGYVYKLTGSVRKRYKDARSFSVNALASWAFSREQFLWKTNVYHLYNASRRAYWDVNAGMLTTDFAGNQGVGSINAWSSLLFRTNYSAFYGNNYIRVAHQTDIANGLEIYTHFEWADRHQLQNNSDISFFYHGKRDFRPNIPRNAEVGVRPELLYDNRAAIFHVRLSYTPERYYSMYNGNKRYLHSKYPTLTWRWTRGIPDIFGSNSSFDFLSMNISQTLNYGYFNRFSYSAEAGKFFNVKNISFADFRHFDVYEPRVSNNRDLGSPYHLLTGYTSSTDKWYVSAKAHYAAPYIILKYIPLLTNILFSENLYASYLLQPQLRHYTEVGYGITFTDVFGIGAFAGFENARYNSWGIRAVIKLIP